MSKPPEKPRLICLMGPTASGKTDLAIELAEHLDCELVSVDSALVYRGMDIGSAKPDYPHHLVDILDPAQPYSAANFATDAARICKDIVARGRTPLLVGGTMLYYRAFLGGLAEMPPADERVRAQLATEAEAYGWPRLHEELQRVDPESAARIHPNHSQRLGRALEVYRATGVPLSEWHRRGATSGAPGDEYEIVQMAICPRDRRVLHNRIALRFEQMMAAGFLEEVRQLWRRPDLHSELPAIRAVGYRQLWQHLDGDIPLEEAVDRAVAATRQLAKRQLTWLRKWPDLLWIYTDQDGNLLENELSEQGRQWAGQKPANLALNFLQAPPL